MKDADSSQTEQRQTRRAEVLEAATALFASRGFAKTTVADVAHSLGLRAPALYYYFPSKEALLFAVLERAMVQLNATLDQQISASASSDPATRLRILVAAQVIEEVRAAKTMPMINDYLYGARRDATHFSAGQVERLRVLQRHTVDLYRSTLRAGQTSGVFRKCELAPTAFALLGLAQYVSAWYRPGSGRLDVRAIAEHHADLAVRSVLA
jgi:AcrR family transcriptional regulator